MRTFQNGDPFDNYLISRNNMLQDLVVAGGALLVRDQLKLPQQVNRGLLAVAGLAVASAAYQGLAAYTWNKAEVGYPLNETAQRLRRQRFTYEQGQ